MKDIYRNPIVYYAALPVVIAFWPLLTKTVYVPKAEKNLKNEKKFFAQAQVEIGKILLLDPGRMADADPNAGPAEFDYAVEIEKTASLHNISAINYSVISRPPRKSGGQKTQNATVPLKDVDIKKFAEFLSALQLRWAGLQCEKITLTRKKTGPDKWDIDLTFKYYY